MIDVTKDKKGKTVATDAEELIAKLVELVSKVEVDTSVAEIESTSSNHLDLMQEKDNFEGVDEPTKELEVDDDLPF